MRNARHQFILLGLVCQSLAWEGYALLFLYVAAWWAVLRFQVDFSRWTRRIDGLALFAGCVFGVAAGSMPQQTPHFFLGHGLAFLQLVRLPRALGERERTQSVLIGFLHLGVACTVVLDYRFLLVLVAALLLIPRMLAESEQDRFPVNASAPGRFRPSLAGMAVLVVVMVVLFLLFPRGLIGTPIQLRRGGADGTLANAVMDPSQGGFLQSSSVLLQIEGTNVHYLRALALPVFDGRTWKPEERPVMVRRFPTNFQPPEELLPRRVRVKDSRVIDRLLPIDGHVLHLRGKFFRDAFLDLDGTVQTVSMWNTGNNFYEYWTRLEPIQEHLPYQLRRRYTQVEAPSARLRSWLDQQVAGAQEPIDKAHRLEAHLRDTFQYQLGAPELKRVNALEEFLLEERRGHCERFASALALLLRMEGIPSRVLVGYVPGRPNEFTGWRNVRYRDAHAWTEAWFEGIGWVEFDATPRGSMELPDSFFADLLHAIDVIWYLNIVNYDVPTQRELLTRTGAVIGGAVDWLQASLPWLGAVVAGMGGIVWVLWRRPFRRVRWGFGRGRREEYARHFYGEALRALSRQGHCKRPEATPHEFLGQLTGAGHPASAELELLTEAFCRSRYGGVALSGGELRMLEDAARRLKTRTRRGADTVLAQ